MELQRRRFSLEQLRERLSTLILGVRPGVTSLPRLVEGLTVLGLEVLPQVLHVPDLGQLQRPAVARPGLHRLSERLIGLTDLLLLLLLLVEGLGCSVVEEFLWSLSCKVSLGPDLDVPSVELGLGLLQLRADPGQGLAGREGGEAGGGERVWGRLHRAAVELGHGPRTDVQRLSVDKVDLERLLMYWSI